MKSSVFTTTIVSSAVTHHAQPRLHSLSRFLTTILLTLCLTSIAVAQHDNPTQARKADLSVSAFASTDRVRFTAPPSVSQIRLEVFNSSGRKLFDNELRGGNVLDWLLQDGQAHTLADDSYLCLITIKTLSGRLSQKIASVSILNGKARLNTTDASQITAQQSEAIGPLEPDASLNILADDDPQTPTLIAHNGEDGLITRGKGALSFRIGDFLRATDSEQMRLTAEGNLGIGLTNPLVRLDVDGLIRATQGIVFPDGSVQFSAARRTFGPQSLKPGQFGKNPSPGQEHLEPQAAGTGTLNFIAKWAESGGAGTLTNSAIFESNGQIGIGTTSPQSGLDYRNPSAAFFTRDVGTVALGSAQSALQLGLSNTASRNAGVGPSFLFFSENSAGAKSFLGRVSGVWENPLAGAEAGAIFFQVRANSGDVNALTERMRITSSGNVGIGTPNPTSKVEIAAQNGLAITGFQPFLTLRDTNAGNKTGFVQSVNGEIALLTNSRAALVLKDISGNVGIGTNTPTSKVEIAAQNGLAITGFQPFLTLRDTNAGGARGIISSGDGDIGFFPNSFIGGSTAVIFKNNGNVGIGTTSPGARLQVDAGNNVGVLANSQGNAVIGLSTGPGFAAVFGENTSGSAGFGVYGKGTNGYAMYAEGNAGQSRDKGGFVKAMVYINGDATILRCYNGLTGSSSGNCGFSARRDVDFTSGGVYIVDFGFTVDDRFWSATAVSATDGVTVSASLSTFSVNRLFITVRNLDNNLTDRPVMLILY